MKRELFNQWVSALRSGKYEQGTSNLCKDNKFCCLGVFLDVAKEEYTTRVDKYNGVYRVYGSCEVVIPTDMANEYGFYSGLGESEDDYSEPLYKLNDKVGKTFSEIADILETKPEVYVKIED